jgi:hypothetical protein
MITPGIFDMAHAKGVGFLSDMNGDGNIDQADLTLATKAKAMTATPAVEAQQ